MKNRLALIMLLALLAGCNHSSETPKEKTESSSPVAVDVVGVKTVSRATDNQYTGTVRARRQAVLSTKLAGKITFLPAEEGDVVDAGSVVAEVDVANLEARTQLAVAGRDAAVANLAQVEAGYKSAQQGVAQSKAQLKALKDQQGEAQARLDQARKDYRRYKTLADEGAIPRQQAERASSELEVAESRMKALQSQIDAASVGVGQSEAAVVQARSRITASEAGINEAEAGIGASAADLKYGRVIAPFRGVVVEKMAYQGELTTPGRALLKLQDLDSLEVSVALPESAVDRVQPGSKFSGSLPSLNKDVELEVRQIIASTDPASRTFDARMTLIDPPTQLFPGTFVKVSVPEQSREVLLVPVETVVTRGQLEGVMAVVDGVAQFRLVQLGRTFPEGREVLSGLKAGDQVVLSPGEGLRDGQKVTTR